MRFFLGLILLLLQSYCTTPSSFVKKNIVVSDFKKLNWKQQITYFREHHFDSKNQNDVDDYKLALTSSYDNVIIEAIEYANRNQYYQFEDLYSALLKHSSPSIRCTAINFYYSQVGNPNMDTYLSKLISFRNDPSWICRENIYKLVRYYKPEKLNKKYYNILLSMLDKEYNSTILKQLLETLTWYNDVRTFKMIYTKSFHCKDDIQLIAIIHELKKYVNEITYKRLKTIVKEHKSYLVRTEALKALE